jgi:CheY-like chemotaxis protein
VLQELKAHEKTKGIPIIVVSILSEKDKALSLGAVDYIEKPVAGQALIKKIELLVHSEEQKGEKKIVVLNGDSAIGASLTEMLEKRGFSTAAFTSPKEAVSYLMADQAQDIAALMIFLENLRDFDFVTLVKEEPNLTRIPIIFITDKEMSRDEVKRLEGISYSLLEKGDLVSPAALFEIDKSIEEARRGTRTPKQETPARRASVSGARIFLVEDNEVNQKLITKILSREGYEVTVADNGADALTVLKDKDFDLILMDIQMPVMDGYEATSRIKSDEKKKMIPIIALTAHAMKGYEEKVYEAGFDGYLKKPIKKEELLAELAERLAGCVDERPAPEEVWAEEEGASSASPEDELKAIYREFDESLPGKYDLVADAVERKDYDAVYRHGHDLKGTGGAFGREKISVLGRQIESAAKEKKDDVLTFLLGSLKDEIESIQKEIQ